MFLTSTRALFVEAFERTFDADYPMAEYRLLGDRVTLDYPMQESEFPGVLVDFVPGTSMQIAGIAYREYTQPGPTGDVRAITRWRFTGYATFTFFTLGSLERDRMVDEFITVLAFGHEDPNRGDFRSWIEGNDLIGLTCNWDQITLTGKAESQGTPWGTEEWIYEQTVQIEVANGEFISDGSTRSLIPMSAILVTPVNEEDPAEVAADAADTQGWI